MNGLDMPRLMVSTRWEAARWAHAYDAVVTVFEPAHLCLYRHPNRYIAEFADRVAYDEGAPTLDDIAGVLKFTARHLGESMLIHCKAGQSRSIAVAIAVAVQHGLTEQQAWEHVYWNCRPPRKVGERPFIPNPRVLQHADALLGTNLLGLSPRAAELKDDSWTRRA